MNVINKQIARSEIMIKSFPPDTFWKTFLSNGRDRGYRSDDHEGTCKGTQDVVFASIRGSESVLLSVEGESFFSIGVSGGESP